MALAKAPTSHSLRKSGSFSSSRTGLLCSSGEFIEDNLPHPEEHRVAMRLEGWNRSCWVTPRSRRAPPERSSRGGDIVLSTKGNSRKRNRETHASPRRLVGARH